MYKITHQNEEYEIPVDPSLLKADELNWFCYKPLHVESIDWRIRCEKRLSLEGRQDKPLTIAQQAEFLNHGPEVEIARCYLFEPCFIMKSEKVQHQAGNTQVLCDHATQYLMWRGWITEPIHPGAYELALLTIPGIRFRRIVGSPYSHFNITSASIIRTGEGKEVFR